jgi:hypothetical protein
MKKSDWIALVFVMAGMLILLLENWVIGVGVTILYLGARMEMR